MAENPYAPPVSNLEASQSHGKATLSRTVISTMEESKTWVRTCAILFTVWSVISIIGGLSELGSPSGRSSFRGDAVILVFAITAAVTVFFYVIPALKLWRYTGRLTSFSESPNSDSLTESLESNRSFFKYMGILAIVTASLFFAIFVFSMLAAISDQRLRY